MTTVLNFKHTRGIPANAVYIGRSMPNIPGNPKFHNPFKMHNENQRDEVCDKYRQHLWNQILRGEVTVADLLALEGKDLVCWCAPKRCHGHTILEAIEWAKKQ